MHPSSLHIQQVPRLAAESDSNTGVKIVSFTTCGSSQRGCVCMFGEEHRKSDAAYSCGPSISLSIFSATSSCYVCNNHLYRRLHSLTEKSCTHQPLSYSKIIQRMSAQPMAHKCSRSYQLCVIDIYQYHKLILYTMFSL